ncbi:MAG: hypothetical protein KJP07_20930, partial [Desulfatitalea sp.]|nr:hypothetical protein [Desulfatitalea sp.]
MTHESVALEALARLFEDMDRNYGETARRHGFACHGCPDNCCHTRFYHHTLVEYLYLRRGLEQMTPAEQGFIRTTASQQVQHANACMNHDQPPRLMCPLNRSERCL